MDNITKKILFLPAVFYRNNDRKNIQISSENRFA